MKPSGFTLVELTMVLLIIAIVSAAVVLRVQGPLNRARQREVVEMIGQFDLTTRAAARQQDRPLQMLVDMSAGELRRTDGEGRELKVVPLRLPGDFRIETVLIRGAGSSDRRAVVPFSRQGLTPSYALALVHGDTRRWLLVAGLTGIVVEVSDEREAQAALAAAEFRTHTR